jgi:hypothetical protein
MTAFRIDARGDARSKIYTPPTVGPTQGVPNEEYGSLNGIAYEFDYFSGTQMGVYFGDLLVDDIVSISFNVNQSKQPIYSYAEQYFHSVAAGRVLVTGSFTIPFKEANYIPYALANYAYKLGNTNVEGSINRAGITPISYGRRNSSSRKKEYLVDRQNIERSLSDRSGIDKYTLYRDLSALPDDVWENVAERYQDVLWKNNKEEDYDSGNLTREEGATWPHPSDSSWQSYRRGDQYPPFDIWLLYGDISNKAANNTIRKIIRCDIMGQEQVIDATGEPILERYQFIARNLV